MTNYSREDNNIFFSALIVFTLQQLRHALPNDLRLKVDNITKRVISNYSLYRHPADRATYNFWQDLPHAHFPNGRLLKYLPFLALPADSDDTSIIYLTSPSFSQFQDIKQKLEGHYQPEAPVSPLTPEAYSDLSAYPTFLGRRIKKEYDVCVVCNILYMVLKFNLTISSIDLDSIEFLRRVLTNRDYHHNPFGVSPNYNNSAIILYHIARLVGSFERPQLEVLKESLIKGLLQESQNSTSFMESLLIRISLLRLGKEPPPLPPPEDWSMAFKNFYFFQAGLLTGLQKSNLNRLAAWEFFHLKYRCEAYYWTLWLEYNVLLQQR